MLLRKQLGKWMDKYLRISISDVHYSLIRRYYISFILSMIIPKQHLWEIYHSTLKRNNSGLNLNSLDLSNMLGLLGISSLIRARDLGM